MGKVIDFIYINPKVQLDSNCFKSLENEIKSIVYGRLEVRHPP